MPTKHRRLRRIINEGRGGRFIGVRRVLAIPASKGCHSDTCPVKYPHYHSSGSGPVKLPKPGYHIVYFDSPRTGSTMTMKVAGLTAKAVRAHIVESNKRFEIPNPEQI